MPDPGSWRGVTQGVGVRRPHEHGLADRVFPSGVIGPAGGPKRLRGVRVPAVVQLVLPLQQPKPHMQPTGIVVVCLLLRNFGPASSAAWRTQLWM